jgi:outer membrane receptor protein involved in Fe transport
MSNSSRDAVASCAADKHWLVRSAVAAAITGGLAVSAMAAEPAAPAAAPATTEIEEVQVTGSRIVRKDLESNSPLVTVERQRLEDKAYISVEEALNDLPQFMAGGVGNNAGVITSNTQANALDGGRGSGDAFNMALLPDNAGALGIVIPGAANVNLRGLGSNRSLVLLDGHRGMPSNASMTVDLNTIPTIAIGNIEVITGGASAVYGADALAGVTNIRLRDNFEGVSLRVRGGINEVGDGGEYQVSGLMGAKSEDGRGRVLIGIEYSKRNSSYWKNRDFFVEAMESPYSNAGNYLFAWEPYYTSTGPINPNVAYSTSNGYNVLQKTWNGNAPLYSAINSVFSDRNCFSGSGTLLNCVATPEGIGNPPAGQAYHPITANTTGAPVGGGWFFNPDGTLYARSSSFITGTGANAITKFYGPQSYNVTQGGTEENPSEARCLFAMAPVPSAAQVAGGSGYTASGPFAGNSCNPTGDRVDYGRWLTLPREGYSLFGNGSFDFNDHLTVFSTFIFSSSKTQTRREPAPLQAGFGAIIPFGSATTIYAPSRATVAAPGVAIGDTLREYQAGGSRGTNCAPVGGCTMAQAFPVSPELRSLLQSRPTVTMANTAAVGAFRGLNACNIYTLATATTPGAQLNPNSGAYYSTMIDPNTGGPVQRCGPNAGWQINAQPSWLPVRGTENITSLYQISGGLKGDLGISDWTWEAYMSYGDSQTPVNYSGFQSLTNYMKIISAPNYGKGYREEGLNSKTLRCTSGINPFDQSLKPSADCLEAILSEQVDRNSMQQRIYELTSQGHLFDLPAGDVRGAVGLSYRKDSYKFTPDSQRARSYVGDSSAGQFGVGMVDESITAKEYFGELIVPVLKDVPGFRVLELELGARHSEYNTGQKVNTYKALASWEPLPWARFRGGYNRAERAPNMSELYATPSGSSNIGQVPIDPCNSANTFPGPVAGTTLGNSTNTPPAIRTQVQNLCKAQIEYWGTTYSDFHADPDNWRIGGGGTLVVGNPLLKNEKGDTWTAGVAFRSPFTSPLASRMTMTVDWYEARVANPIEVATTTQVLNSCFNINGLNPGYTMDDPLGYCKLTERDTATGQVLRVYNTYTNQNKLVIRGIDVTMSWTGNFSDMNMESVPGALSLNIAGNYLMDQIQFYGGTVTADYAGYSGASPLRTNTTLSYNWGRGNRVSVNWNYTLGTQTPTTFSAASTANNVTTSPTIKNNELFAGNHTANMFSATVGTRIGPVNAALTVNNLLDAAPSRAGYDLRDPNQGIGTFNPFSDLVGRRYSMNLSMDF